MPGKNFLHVLLILAAIMFFAGCTKNNPAASDTRKVVNVIMQRIDNGGLSGEQFVAYIADSSGATITTAEVSLIGPSGIIGTPVTNGMFIYQVMGSAPDWVFSGNYAVSITHNAVNYYGTFTSNSDITVAADGSSVNWGYAAEAAFITVTTPAPAFQMLGPLSGTSYNINPAIYSAPGTYSITPQITDSKSITFANSALVLGNAVIQHQKMVQVNK